MNAYMYMIWSYQHYKCNLISITIDSMQRTAFPLNHCITTFHWRGSVDHPTCIQLNKEGIWCLHVEWRSMIINTMLPVGFILQALNHFCKQRGKIKFFTMKYKCHPSYNGSDPSSFHQSSRIKCYHTAVNGFFSYRCYIMQWWIAHDSSSALKMLTIVAVQI